MPIKKEQPSLLRQYLGDIGPVIDDAQKRPDHYSRAQHEQLELLQHGRPIQPRDETDLLLQYMRRTEAQQTEKKTRTRYSSQSVTPATAPPPFEEQHLFSGTIKLI